MSFFSWSRYVVRRRVIVNMKSGRAFRGILWKKSGALLVLRQVELMEPGAPEPILVDGEVIIERSEVDFIQAP